MANWHWALLLKPLIGLGLILAYYLFIIKGLQLLHRIWPDSSVKRFLFKERGTDSYWSVANNGRRRRSGTGRELE